MAEMNTAAKVLELARGELWTDSGDKYVTYYNEITGSHLPLGCAWCACFVTWVMRHAGVPTDSVCNYKGCATGSEWFAGRGRFMGRGSGYIPKPGDIVMYEWNPEDEGTPRDDGDDHTGIVERVENGRIYTIEGNNGNAVRRDWWSIWAPEISGYCVPLYNVAAPEKPEKEELKVTYDEWKEFQRRYEQEQADLEAQKWALPAIEYCKEHGIMVGRGADDFDPRSNVTRQELAQVAMKLDQRKGAGK